MNNLEYFDLIFSSDGQIIPGVAVKWATKKGITVNTFDDYFKVLLKMSNLKLSKSQFEKFKNQMWKGVKWSPYLLKVGQVVRLYNKRFTGNRYVITALHPLGFDVYNQRLPQYRFSDLDYDSIDRIL